MRQADRFSLRDMTGLYANLTIAQITLLLRLMEVRYVQRLIALRARKGRFVTTNDGRILTKESVRLYLMGGNNINLIRRVFRGLPYSLRRLFKDTVRLITF